MNTTYDAEMMIWITDLKGVRLPFRAAALVYKFLVRAICETNLQWTSLCPLYPRRSMEISSDKKVATTDLGDCYATWCVSGPLNDILPSYFQIKIHQIGFNNAYCGLGVVSNKIMSNPPSGAALWISESRGLMFCNPGTGKVSWDAVVFSRKEYRAWKDQFKPGDLVTFLFMPTECILAMHCKRWGRGGVRVSSLGPIPKSRRKSNHTPGSDDIFHVMFGAAMKDDSVSLIGEKVALPKPLKEFLSRNIGKSE